MYLPPYVTSVSADSFAGKTLRFRIPSILQTVLAENDFDVEIQNKLSSLGNTIPFGKIEKFKYIDEEEANYWEVLFTTYLEANWLELPFYFAEALFYRKILEATNWFHNKVDPFEQHKTKSIHEQYGQIDKVLAFTDQISDESFSDTHLSEMLYTSLWGNQADLSLFHDGDIPKANITDNDLQNKLVANDIKHLLEVIENGCQQIDFFIDNAGLELTGDICLALYLIESKKVSTINFHVKEAPIFVSDALEKDIFQVLNTIKSDHLSKQKIAKSFENYIQSGQIKILPHLFWNSPLFFNQLPEDILQILKKSDLVISKGDANYRRFLQDRQWGFNDPLSKVIYYFNKPLLLLRTLKSEVLAGTNKVSIQAAARRDKNWLTNGQFGLIQLHNFL